MIADEHAMSRLERLELSLKRAYLRMKLMKFRCLRLILGLQIRGGALKCRVLGRNETKALLENRRRAMFVDKFFEQLKNVHKTPNARGNRRKDRVAGLASG